MALLSKKVAHLFCHFSPSAGGIVVENEANDCQEQKNKRREVAGITKISRLKFE
jgi:hypothetical protein